MIYYWEVAYIDILQIIYISRDDLLIAIGFGAATSPNATVDFATVAQAVRWRIGR